VPAIDPPADPAAVLAEATRRSGLVWVTVPGRLPRPAWHVWHDGAVWLLVARAPGSPEQSVPGLLTAARVRVTVRSRDKGGRLVTYDATTRSLEPGSAEWAELLPPLLDGRLNVPDGVAAARDRWARECALVRLEPVLPLVEGPGTLPTGSHAAPPAGSPARTPTPLPPRHGPRD
jgi:hypothetical protein